MSLTGMESRLTKKEMKNIMAVSGDSARKYGHCGSACDC